MEIPYRRVERIGDCTLYLGDALRVIPEMVKKREFADCIVTDPPYLLTSGGRTSGGLHERFGKAPTPYGNSGQLVTCEIGWTDFMPALFAILRRGHCYVMANNRNVQAMLNAATAAGFGFHNLLVWHKRSATPNRWYMKSCEFVGLLYKGKARRINNCGAGQLVTLAQVDETGHPTEKPVLLMEFYIGNSTDPGMTVCDPFMGSGTTGVACARLGRRFIGIEIDDGWFDVACERITQALAQPYLFREDGLHGLQGDLF